MPTMAELAAAIVARQELPPDKGDMGPIGPNGKAGLDGSNGRNGDPGPKGATGDRGPIGANGADGRNGADGKDGVDGDPGLVWRGPWVRNMAYYPDDAVEQDGSSYVCTVATRSKPPSGAWDLLAKRGATGPPGMSRGGGGGGGGGSALTVKDEGTILDTAAASIDFTGAGVTATNVGHAVTVTIPGGGGGSGVLEQGAGSPAGNDEFQSYYLTGNPTGGTFTVTFDGQETGPIDWNTTEADFVAAIEALPNVGVGNVDVDPLPSGPFPTDIISLTFVNALGRQSVPDLAIADNSLTGGTSPDFNGGGIFPGAAPVALTPLVELAYDTARNAVWANIGTVLAPDWKPITLIGTYDANGNPLAEVDVLAAPSFVRYDPITGLITDSARIGSGGASRITHFDDAGGQTFLNLNAVQAELSGSGIAEIVINNSNDVVEIVASALQAELNGSTGNAGEVLTAQGDDTALWGTVIAALIAGGAQAAFVPDPATPEQIRDSLVAAGLMAAA